MRTLAWVALGYVVFSVFSFFIFNIWAIIMVALVGTFFIAALAWKIEYVGRVYSEENGKMLDEIIKLRKEMQELKEKYVMDTRATT